MQHAFTIKMIQKISNRLRQSVLLLLSLPLPLPLYVMLAAPHLHVDMWQLLGWNFLQGTCLCKCISNAGNISIIYFLKIHNANQWSVTHRTCNCWLWGQSTIHVSLLY